MPKHAVRQFTPARLILGLAAAILVVLVGLVAVRADGGPAVAEGPKLVQPTGEPTDLQAVEASLPPATEALTVSPSVSPTASASASAPASPSPTPSRSASASPSASASVRPSPAPSKTAATPSPVPSKTTTSPAPVNTLNVSYSTTASWRDGFIAGVRVTNNGTTTRDFAVTLTYPGSGDIWIRSAWNASVDADDNQVTIRGTGLAAGSSISAGFQAGKDDGDSVRSVTCSVGGGSCRVG